MKSSSPTSLLKHGHSGPCPGGFWTPPRMKCLQTLGELCQCSVSLPVMQRFLVFRRNLLCGAVCAHCLRDPESHWKEPGSVHFVPSFQVFLHINKLPSEPSPGWNRPSSSQLFFLCQRLQSLDSFCGLSLNSSSISTSLLCWGAQHWSQYSRYVSPVLSRGEGWITPLNLLAILFLMPPSPYH